ncbi:MAG: MBL fold metallo-hydrolase, partial [Thermoproteota archaeon]|nr:MBL fold metallo-hydrolase [Thermoproteota archaeon]
MTTENIEKSTNSGENISNVSFDKKEYNGSSKITIDYEVQLEKEIMKLLPTEAIITSAKFEGTNIALYTRNPEFSLTELSLHLSALSKSLKKRFIIRTDPSIRLSEDETRADITKILPKEISVSVIFCDEATGEVVLEVNKPEGITSDIFLKIAKNTGWITHTRRSPHIPSNSIKNIHSTLKSSSKERQIFYQRLGKRIFRPILLPSNLLQNNDNQKTVNNPQHNLVMSDSLENVHGYNNNGPFNYRYNNLREVILYCLGGVKQVGRSYFVVVTPESKIMLDCGINPGENQSYNAYPRIDWFNFNLEELDAVVISHAHIDHQGFLPT